MKKLFLVTHEGGQETLVVANSMVECVTAYDGCKSIEVKSEKVMVLGNSKRYDLLKEAYDFINNGACTVHNSVRVELENRIKEHLGVITD